MSTRAEGDRGVVVPLIAIAMLAILIMVALVIDLGATRSLRRDTRLAADAGATAGAVELQNGLTGIPACTAAFQYTFENLGIAAPDLTVPCSGFAGACVAGTPRSGTATAGGVTVTVKNPVANGDDLMQATSLGSGVTQTANAAHDGTVCERVGVEVTRAQQRFFGGVISGSSGSFAVHSVARYSPEIFRGEVPPALVALDQTACNGIDAGNNGKIVIKSSPTGAGVARSDSDGSSCPSGYILNSSNPPSRLIAESSGANAGQLAWFRAPAAKGWRMASTHADFGNEASALNYVGLMISRANRTTRVPVDTQFHCLNAPVTPTEPLCAATDDPVQQWLDWANATGEPSGFTTYTGCEAPAPVAPSTTRVLGTPGQKLFVDCTGTFSVKGGRVDIAAGATVIFGGKLSIEAGGTLVTNVGTLPSLAPIPVTCTRLSDPVLPTPATAVDTTLIIRSTAADALSYQSSEARSVLARTTIVNLGGANLQGGPSVQWTPAEDGTATGLLYWSESSQEVSYGGDPRFAARGIMFHGNGDVTARGNGVIDLQKVQVWSNRARISTGTPTMCLSPDPEFNVPDTSGGTALVR